MNSKLYFHSIFILIGATTICLKGFTQNIGIGTNSATYPLTVIAQGNTGIVQKKGSVEIGFITSAEGIGISTLSNHNLHFATNNGAAHLTLSTSGDLGIGTAIPSVRLDVNGTVRISGGNPALGRVLTAIDANGHAEWRNNPALGARMVFIPHPAFIPENTSVGYTTLEPGIGRRPLYPVAGSNKFLAPILLPVGAVIREITWYFEDWNEAQNMSFTLMRDNNGTATAVSQVSSSGSVSGGGLRTLTVPLNYVMIAQYHWLEVNVNNWPSTFTLQIAGAKITYDL